MHFMPRVSPMRQPRLYTVLAFGTILLLMVLHADADYRRRRGGGHGDVAISVPTRYY